MPTDNARRNALDPSHAALCLPRHTTEKRRAANTASHNQWLRSVNGDMGVAKHRQEVLLRKLKRTRKGGGKAKMAEKAREQRLLAKEEKEAKWRERVKAIETLKR